MGQPRAYRSGDFVKLLKVPEELFKLPRETVEALKKATGRALRVTGTSPDGHVQVDVGEIPNFGSRRIWVETDHLEYIPILTNDAL